MKKYVLTAASALFFCITSLAQSPVIQVQSGTASMETAASSLAPENGPVAKAAASVINDTLLYFFNKHYFRNPNTPTSSPPNLSFYTVKSPYPGSLAISHLGSVFLNTNLITVHGLKALVIKHPGSPSASVPFRLYLCSVNSSSLPVFPPIDSVLTSVSTSTIGVWRGGVFTSPTSLNGNFAVVAKCTSTVPGDTIRVFLNNASTSTSTYAPATQYGEGLGVLRFFGNFQSNTNTFGTGTDYEFVVAPYVSYNINAGATVLTPTICSLTQGSFSNVTTPMSLIESRFFNLNKFKPYWAPTNTSMPPTDSIYNWTFSGSITPPTTNKNASAIFNILGNQTANLTVKIKSYNFFYSANYNFNDVSVATITVSNGSAPTLSVSGTTTFCSNSFVTTTLTVSGASNFTWTSPYSLSNSVVVTSSSTTVYTVMSENLGCTAVKLVTVAVNAIPNVLLITSNSLVCTSSSGGSTISLSGTPLGGIYSGANVSGPKFTPAVSGTFSPVYSYTNVTTGCTNTTTALIRVIICSGLDQVEPGPQFKAFPNPTINGRLVVSNLQGNNLVELYSVLGELLFKQSSDRDECTLDLSQRAAGTYFLKVTDGAGRAKTVKIVNPD